MRMNQVPTTKTDHLEFYLEHNISPVSQDISDLSKHFDRRGSLYRYLGLPKIFFSGRDVLEVGPGSGHNSLYVASCQPKSFDLLEPNPAGQQGITQLYDQLAIDHATPTLIKQRLEDFAPQRKYDVAISECWLGVSRHERDMMIKLASCVKPGGILITTLASPIGAVPNTLRRILGDMLIRECTSIEEKTDVLVRAFGSHLATMKDMTRPYEDWVQDSLLNPGFLTICPTPAMFMEDLGDAFSIHNSYPRFNADWRWYKSLYGENKRLNEQFMESYFMNCHNFYDYNDLFAQRDPAGNIALEDASFRLLSMVVDMEEKDAGIPFAELSGVVKEIQAQLASISPDWADGVEEWLSLFLSKKVTVEQVSGMQKMKPVFGRELLYVSAIREV